MPYMESHLQFIKDNMSEGSKTQFSQLEYEKFRRVVDYMKSTEYSSEKTLEGRKDFWNYFNEHDRRRNTDFKSTFPEMSEFFKLCKQANE